MKKLVSFALAAAFSFGCFTEVGALENFEDINPENITWYGAKPISEYEIIKNGDITSYSAKPISEYEVLYEDENKNYGYLKNQIFLSAKMDATLEQVVEIADKIGADVVFWLNAGSVINHFHLEFREDKNLEFLLETADKLVEDYNIFVLGSHVYLDLELGLDLQPQPGLFPIISLSSSEKNINIGETCQITVKVYNSNNKEVIWSTSDSSIAEVSKDGIVTSLREGTVEITATLASDGVEDTIAITVSRNKTSINNAALVLTNCKAYNQTPVIKIGNTKSRAAVIPEIVLKDGDKILEVGKDYTVTYENNLSPGTATAKITGIGEYEGTAEQNFVIAVNGDINGDNEFSLTDIVEFKKIFLGFSGYEKENYSPWVLDVQNKQEGNVSLSDVVFLKKVFLGFNGYNFE